MWKQSGNGEGGMVDKGREGRTGQNDVPYVLLCYCSPAVLYKHFVIITKPTTDNPSSSRQNAQSFFTPPLLLVFCARVLYQQAKRASERLHNRERARAGC